MTFAKTCAYVLGLAVAAMVTVGPASAQGCLSPTERNAAVSGGQAMPLNQATRALRPEHRGEVINARLCRAGGNLVYLLTVVDRRGKVTRVRLDAKNGQVVQVR
jgi:hypothetical protein